MVRNTRTCKQDPPEKTGLVFEIGISDRSLLQPGQSSRNQELREQYDSAVADYDEAIRLNPDLAEAYFNRGNTKIALGLKDAAREGLRKSA